MKPKKECPNTKQDDPKCIDGLLWAYTYSEMGPPDQRQCIGPCPRCNPDGDET